MPDDVYTDENPEYGNRPAFDQMLADAPDEAQIHPKPAKPEELPSKPEEFLSKPEEYAPYQGEVTDPGPVGEGRVAQPGDGMDARVTAAPQVVAGTDEFLVSVDPDPAYVVPEPAEEPAPEVVPEPEPQPGSSPEVEKARAVDAFDAGFAAAPKKKGKR